MAHYALIDDNNIVVTVIVGADENLDGIDWEKHYTDLYNQTCKRTSYNTVGNTQLILACEPSSGREAVSLKRKIIRKLYKC